MAADYLAQRIFKILQVSLLNLSPGFGLCPLPNSFVVILLLKFSALDYNIHGDVLEAIYNSLEHVTSY